MTNSQSGVLTITSVPAAAQAAVTDYLAKCSKSATKEQVNSMLSQLPLQLSDRIPAHSAARVVQELHALGAVARFTPHPSPPGARQVSPREEREQPSFREVLLEEAFAAKTLRFPVSLPYQAGLLVVALAMIMLPLIYLGIIGSAACLLFWHATQNLALSHKNSFRLFLFLYVTPLIVGGLLIFFMIKPLFARLAARQQPYEIDRKSEPLLFAFVEKICTTIGAPMPVKICLDNLVNASASLDGGIMGAVLKRDLVLTIGLPLAAGLDLNGFAGVLAHEFGHFSQSSGMRLTYIIRSINHWFARVVFEEDEWDLRLRRWSKDWDIRIGIVLYIARFFIWLTRKILFLLMRAGNAVSSYMLRQMEFDADRYEAALVGPAVFEATSHRLATLDLSHSWAFGDLSQSWEEGRLPDDLTGLVLSNLRLMKTETKNKLVQDTLARKTGPFDTHPATSERIGAARAITLPPLFSWPDNRATFTGQHPAGKEDDSATIPPASALFGNFADLSKKVTIAYYRSVLGVVPEKKQLVDVSSLVRAQEKEQRYFEALDRYFLGKYVPWHPLGVSRAGDPDSRADEADTLLERLRSLRDDILRNDAEHAQVLTSYNGLRERMVLAAQARSLIEAGFRVNPKEFSIPGAKIEAVETAETRHAEREAAIAREMEQTASRYRERLAIGLRLLHMPGVAAKAGNGETSPLEFRRYWDALRALEHECRQLQKLNLCTEQLAILAHQLPQYDDDEKLLGNLRLKMEEVHGHLDTLTRSIANVPYPFEHSVREMKLDAFIVGDMPEKNDLYAILDTAEKTVQSTLKLRSRLAAHLANAAEGAEKAFSLMPLGET